LAQPVAYAEESAQMAQAPRLAGWIDPVQVAARQIRKSIELPQEAASNGEPQIGWRFGRPLSGTLRVTEGWKEESDEDESAGQHYRG
jgi:hypothetical protein